MVVPTKGKDKEKKAVKSTTSGVAASAKSKIVLNTKIEPLEKAIPPKYVTKNWSALAVRGQNSNLKVYFMCIEIYKF